MAGDLDRDVGGRRRILMAQQPDRGDRDRDQDQHRHQRPDDLDRGVVRVARRRRVGAAAKADHRVQQQAEHEDADDRAQRQQPVVMERARLPRRSA